MLREDGLVRPIDGSGRVWQVAHDFIANQLSLLLGRLRPPWWRRAAPYATPALAGTWLAAMAAAFWLVPDWQHDRALRSLIALGLTITGDRESGYAIWNSSTVHGGALEQLGRQGDHLGHIRELWIQQHAYASDLRALAGSTGFRHLTLLVVSDNDALTSLDGLPDMPNLKTLQVSGNDALTSLDGLPDMPRLETFELRSGRTVAASTTVAAMTSLQRLALYLPNAGEVLAVAAASPELKEVLLDPLQVTDALIGEFMAERRKAALAEPTVSFAGGFRTH